ncbi:20 kDa chaperonin, chloroplastic-like [Wolffia australiana]
MSKNVEVLMMLKSWYNNDDLIAEEDEDGDEDDRPFDIRGGEQIKCSKYAGTEVELSGMPHIILKEEDVVDVLDSDDIKDLKSLNDRVLIKIASAKDTTDSGFLLTKVMKEKPSLGNTVLYSTNVKIDFNISDGSD